MKYGLPYMGSKNRLAERILDLMPRADHLIDLMCGGCAVTHAAMLKGRYPHIHINDADWRPVELFMGALEGRYADEKRWVSREEFHRLKHTDPYVAYVWSFGNNGEDYLYGAEVEPFKRALHQAIFFDDIEPARAYGLDLSFVLPIQGERRRYLAIRRYLQEEVSRLPFANAACNTGSGTEKRPVFMENFCRRAVVNNIVGGDSCH